MDAQAQQRPTGRVILDDLHIVFNSKVPMPDRRKAVRRTAIECLTSRGKWWVRSAPHKPPKQVRQPNTPRISPLHRAASFAMAAQLIVPATVNAQSVANVINWFSASSDDVYCKADTDFDNALRAGDIQAAADRVVFALRAAQITDPIVFPSAVGIALKDANLGTGETTNTADPLYIQNDRAVSILRDLRDQIPGILITHQIALDSNKIVTGYFVRIRESDDRAVAVVLAARLEVACMRIDQAVAIRFRNRPATDRQALAAQLKTALVASLRDASHCPVDVLQATQSLRSFVETGRTADGLQIVGAIDIRGDLNGSDHESAWKECGIAAASAALSCARPIADYAECVRQFGGPGPYGLNAAACAGSVDASDLTDCLRDSGEAAIACMEAAKTAASRGSHEVNTREHSTRESISQGDRRDGHGRRDGGNFEF